RKVAMRISKFIFMVLVLTQIAMASKWPQVRAFQKHFTFDDPKFMYLNVPVMDVSGRTVYVLECASPWDTHADMRNRQLNPIGYSWTGQFACRLGIPGAAMLPDDQLLVSS